MLRITSVLSWLKGWLPSRARKRPPTTVVLHATVSGDAKSSIRWLQKISLSYHFLVDKDGTIHKAVPVGRVALHAGKSVGPEGPNVNDYSIGIALVNWNDGKDPYTPAQVESVIELLRLLKTAEPTLKWLTTHWAVSPGRKTDPKAYPVYLTAQMTRYKWWSAGVVK